MSELKNFPFKNQLAQVDIDGIPDVNSHMECVATSIASGLQYLTGKEYEGEELAHAIYGKGYIGGTAAINYEGYCSKAGVRLFPINGTGNYLVPQIHKALSEGKPVIGTIPSTYAPPDNPLDPGPSHAIIFYKDDTNLLVAMNPWQAFSQSNSDNWWSHRFCFNQIWVMEKTTISTLDDLKAHGWEDNGNELIAPNKVKVVLGFRDYVLASWHPENYPIEVEHVTANGSSQLFYYSELGYDKKTNHISELPIGLHVQALSKQVVTLGTLLNKKPVEPVPTPIHLPDFTEAMTSLKPLADLYLTLYNLKVETK